MIYQVLRPIARLAHFLYFRKAFILNVEAVPKKGPLLLVCNHPSSFFEPCVLAVLLPRPLYFLTRGDFFKNRVFRWFLEQTHQIPIFRQQDGFDKLRNNQGTFAFCYQALSDDKAILMFPESWTVLEKRLRPLQKGAARLALGSLQHIPDLHILPVGVTFSNPLKFRSTVTVRCGEPIPVTTPKSGDEREAMAEITAQLESAMRSLIIHIDKPEREPLYDALQELKFTSSGVPSIPRFSSDSAFPREEQTLAEYVNGLSDEKESELSTQISAYAAALYKYGLIDRYFTRKFPWSFVGQLLRLPGALCLFLGKLFFALPASLIVRFLNKKIHNLPYYGPLKWLMGFFCLGLWALIWLLVAWLIWGVIGLGVFAAWILLGYFTLMYFHDLSLRGYLAPLRMSRHLRKELLAMRASII